MKSVGCVLLCCVLFVHMGLGDAVSGVIKRNATLFQCVKCTTFWAILAYTLFLTEYEPVECAAIAFGCAYIALWVDLLFAKISVWYEKFYKSMVTEEHDGDSEGDKKDKLQTRKGDKMP